MTDSIANLLIGLMAVICYGSFIWAILCFFRQEAGMPGRMKVISATGSMSMIAHLIGIATQTSADVVRVSLAVAGYALSLAIFWWALRTTWNQRLGIAFSTNEPDRLIRVGPYRFVRHPIYCSYLLAWAAGATAIPYWWPWAVLPIMGTQYLLAINHEENQFLLAALAEDYRNLIRNTGMLFPNPLKMARRQTASRG